MKHTVELIELPNGSKGLLIDVPDATVMNFDFNFRAGDYLSPPDKWDTAHVMEHMVLGANKRFHSSSNFSREFCKNGAYNNAGTSTYHMSYEAECADFESERILDLLCLAIEAPLFLESEFIAEKANIKDELRSLSNNHHSTLGLSMGNAMGFCEVPLPKREKMLKNIELSDIKNHYKATHTASNLRFFIAGQINKRKKAILSRINQMEIGEGSGRKEIIDEKLVSLNQPLLIANPTVDNIYYRWETVIDHILSDAEEYASGVLFGMLLGTMHSRILGVAREKGLVYGIGYGKYRTKNQHVWWIGGQVIPENINSLFKLFVKELKAVAAGEITEQEMKDAKQFALGNFQRSVQTVGQLMSGYYSRFVFDDEIEDYFKVPDFINSVTRKQVIGFAKEALDNNNINGLGFYGSTNQIDEAKLQEVLKSAYL